jgi:hypothetical protein
VKHRLEGFLIPVDIGENRDACHESLPISIGGRAQRQFPLPPPGLSQCVLGGEARPGHALRDAPPAESSVGGSRRGDP